MLDNTVKVKRYQKNPFPGLSREPLFALKVIWPMLQSSRRHESATDETVMFGTASPIAAHPFSRPDFVGAPGQDGRLPVRHPGVVQGERGLRPCGVAREHVLLPAGVPRVVSDVSQIPSDDTFPAPVSAFLIRFD